MSNKAAKTKKNPKPTRRTVGLRTSPVSYSDNKVDVDKENGIIRNVALMTVGKAEGHGFDIDGTSIDQLVALAGGPSDGVKSRFRHPPIEEKRDAEGNIQQIVGDDTGTQVGRIKNIRKDGNQARGDVHLGTYAEIIPGLGDVREYLIRHADEDPSGIGMSAMFEFDVDPETDDDGNILSLPARLTKLYAIDFVGKPAANPNGLLSAQQQVPNSGWQDPDPQAPAAAPLPVSTPEGSVRANILKAIAKEGPQHLGGLVARTRFNGRLEALRADADWLVSHGYAEKTPRNEYKATPAGITRAAMSWT